MKAEKFLTALLLATGTAVYATFTDGGAGVVTPVELSGFAAGLLKAALAIGLFWAFDHYVLDEVDTVAELKAGNVAYALALLALAVLLSATVATAQPVSTLPAVTETDDGAAGAADGLPTPGARALEAGPPAEGAGRRAARPDRLPRVAMGDGEVGRAAGSVARPAPVGSDGLAMEPRGGAARGADGAVRGVGAVVGEFAGEGPLGLCAAGAGDGLPRAVVIRAPAALDVDGVGDLVADGVLDLLGREVRGEVGRERDPPGAGPADAEASAGAVEPEGPASVLERLTEELTAERVHEPEREGAGVVEGGHGGRSAAPRGAAVMVRLVLAG